MEIYFMYKAVRAAKALHCVGFHTPSQNAFELPWNKIKQDFKQAATEHPDTDAATH